MDSKTLSVLEFPKVLDRLAAHCDFSASRHLALALEPTSSPDLALARQRETSEARHLLSIHDLSIGGAHDIRPQAELAARGGVLEPQDLLDVKKPTRCCSGRWGSSSWTIPFRAGSRRVRRPLLTSSTARRDSRSSPTCPGTCSAPCRGLRQRPALTAFKFLAISLLYFVLLGVTFAAGMNYSILSL